MTTGLWGLVHLPLRWRVFVSVAILLLLPPTFAPPAASAARKTKPASESKSPDQQAGERLGEAWSAFYAGRLKQSYRLAGSLTKLTSRRELRWAALQAAHIQARCLWARGDRRSRQKAGQIWSKLGRSSTRNSLRQRLKIAEALRLEEAWDDADRPGFERVTRLLEEVLKDNQPHTATPEAAILLGRIRAEAGQFEKARKALKFAIDLMGAEGAAGRLEIPEKLTRVFLEEAKAVRKRLTYQSDAGRAEFEAAERLRRAARADRGRERLRKYRKALQAYRELVRTFPRSGYAPRSQVAIGHCLIGLQMPGRAAAHWNKFVRAEPSGPWRGQAFVALIDLLLRQKLNLEKAAKCAELARPAVSRGLAGERSAASWKTVAREVWIRIGLVSFCRGEHEVAAEAFREARNRTGDRHSTERLQRLIDAAASGRALIPGELAGEGSSEGKMSRPALALSIGMIHHLAGREQKALAFFEFAGGRSGDKNSRDRRPMAGATSLQIAFSEFGRGAALQSGKKTNQALRHFRRSLKKSPAGTWHDETLCRIGTIIEKRAEKKGSTPAELATGRAEALPWWRRILKNHPKSPRRELASYHIGLLRDELARAAADRTSGKTWQGIAADLTQFCKDYPASPHAGDAAVRAIDIALERLFDMEAASEAAKAAVGWAEKIKNAGPNSAGRKGLPAWYMSEDRPTGKQLDEILFKCYSRAGLVWHLLGRQDRAVEMFRAAKRYENTPRAGAGVQTGMDRMVAIARGAIDPLTPGDLLSGLKHEKQKTALRLGDLALLRFRPKRAEKLYGRLLAGSNPFPDPSNRLKSYLFFRMGQSLKYQRRSEEARAYLKRLYDPKYRDYRWAADGIFRVGTWMQNEMQDAEAAMPHWEHVFTHNPEHPEAERSLFYYGIMAMHRQQYAKAKKAFTEYLRRYPDSRWTERVRTKLLPKANRLTKES
ncbi:MAG: tetratricopeptide repeat protein, partial [Planctomycetes bacterium]|nr:tetratricopeptide repeat protein [Planctomycetota bacterium]